MPARKFSLEPGHCNREKALLYLDLEGVAICDTMTIKFKEKKVEKLQFKYYTQLNLAFQKG